MSNFCEFVDGDMTEEDRKKIDELLIKIDEENELSEKIEKLEAENARLREALEFYANTDVYEYYDKYESTAIQNEGGQKAREALKELLK